MSLKGLNKQKLANGEGDIGKWGGGVVLNDLNWLDRIIFYETALIDNDTYWQVK